MSDCEHEWVQEWLAASDGTVSMSRVCRKCNALQANVLTLTMRQLVALQEASAAEFIEEHEHSRKRTEKSDAR